MPGSPRSNDPRHPRMIQARERDRQSLELRAAGATVTVIAAQLGITPGAVSKCITRALAASQPGSQAIEERRSLVQERNDRRRLLLEQIIGREHPILEKGKPVTVTRVGRDGVSRDEWLDDDGIKLAALDRLARCDEDERKLWGLDAAKRYEMSGVDGGPVEHEVRLASLVDRIVALRSLPTGDVP